MGAPHDQLVEKSSLAEYEFEYPSDPFADIIEPVFRPE
jgi:hypothetical protein